MADADRWSTVPHIPKLPGPHADALRTLLAGLAGTDIVWVLTGSAAFALQGRPVEPDDLDVQTDAPGAYAIEARFADRSIRPVALRASERVRSHFGALELDGVRVEIMGDIEKRRADGSWTPPPDLAQLRRWIAWDDVRVPVLPLTYERDAYQQLGRRDRARLLTAWLSGCAEI